MSVPSFSEFLTSAKSSSLNATSTVTNQRMISLEERIRFLEMKVDENSQIMKDVLETMQKILKNQEDNAVRSSKIESILEELPEFLGRSTGETKDTTAVRVLNSRTVTISSNGHSDESILSESDVNESVSPQTVKPAGAARTRYNEHIYELTSSSDSDEYLTQIASQLKHHFKK